LVLNGDIVDIWNFRKSYFPKSHIKVKPSTWIQGIGLKI
jgi:UDP-2,3-diacylglucosamine pyrophosphatase LpxH